jgi:predicted DNA-binding ribbon-helix-helix protein
MNSNSAVIKRSVIIDGRKTSISLENEFWDALRDVADRANIPLLKLVEEIQKDRTTCHLSSAIRIFLLNHFRGHGNPPKFRALNGGNDPEKKAVRARRTNAELLVFKSR